MKIIKRLIFALFCLTLFPFIITEMTVRVCFAAPAWWLFTGDSDYVMDGCYTFNLINYIESKLGI